MIVSFGLDEKLPFELTPDTINALGGKGYGLAQMHQLGLPVPPGIIITTDHCQEYMEADAERKRMAVTTIVGQVMVELQKLEAKYGYLPLLSIRSGARVSMPGMMDTILNVGLTVNNVEEWMDRIGPVCAEDSFCRGIEMYGTVVKGLSRSIFAGLESPESYLNVYHGATDEAYPTNVIDMLENGITAVFESWNNERAIVYRRMHGYDDDWGTAVIIQAMVFGNMGEGSCSGVLFTRNPSNGDNIMTGEFLPEAQGEDVVAGTHTPLSLDELGAWNSDVMAKLHLYSIRLETFFRDMQDIEFTVQEGELFILQTRPGKRTAGAAFKIALDLIADETIDVAEAIKRVSVDEYKRLAKVAIRDEENAPEPIGHGISAGGGIVIGKAVFSTATAKKAKEPVILVRNETDPNDLEGMKAAVGTLTRTGGLTSHAAVVNRGLGKSCVCGVTDLFIGNDNALLNDVQIDEGDMVAIDGDTGRVWFKNVPEVVSIREGHVGRDLAKLVLDRAGLLPRGKLSDRNNKGQVVIDTSEWVDFGKSLKDLAAQCKKSKVASSGVIVELTSSYRAPSLAEGSLLKLVDIDPVQQEQDRINWATQFEATHGIQFTYLVSLEGGFLNAHPCPLKFVEYSSSLDDLLKKGTMFLDWAKLDKKLNGRLDEVLNTMHSAGAIQATVIQGISEIDRAILAALDV